MSRLCKYNEDCKPFNAIDRNLNAKDDKICFGAYNQVGNCQLYDLFAKLEEVEIKARKMNESLYNVLESEKPYKGNTLLL